MFLLRFVVLGSLLSLVSVSSIATEIAPLCDRQLEKIEPLIDSMQTIKRDYKDKFESICSKWPQNSEWLFKCSKTPDEQYRSIKIRPNFKSSFLDSPQFIRLNPPIHREPNKFARSFNRLVRHFCQPKQEMEKCSALMAISELRDQNAIQKPCGYLDLQSQDLLVNTRLSHKFSGPNQKRFLSDDFEVQPTALIPESESNSNLAKSFRHRFFCESVEQKWEKNLNWFYTNQPDNQYLIHRNLSFYIKKKKLVKGDRGSYLINLADSLRKNCSQ